MWSSRDISLVIITAVVVFILSVSIFQLPRILTGNGGLVYSTTIGMAFTISITLLLFEGRRWRFVAHNTLVVLLSLPTSFMGAPFDVFPRSIAFLAAFPVDLILNSLYQKFKDSDKLVWWSVLVNLVFFSLLPLLQLLLFPLYFPPQYMEVFANILLVMSPWIIGGAIGGGYFGYKVYRRIT